MKRLILLIGILLSIGTVLGDTIEQNDYIYYTCNNATSPGALLCSNSNLTCYNSTDILTVNASATNIMTGWFKFQYTNTTGRYGCFINCCEGAVDYAFPVYVTTAPLVVTDNVGINLDDVSGTLDIGETTGIADNTTLTYVLNNQSKLVTAAGFSTHSEADIWTTGGRALSTPADYKANISDLATQVNLTEGVVVLTSATEIQIDDIEADTNEIQLNQTKLVTADISTLQTEVNAAARYDNLSGNQTNLMAAINNVLTNQTTIVSKLNDIIGYVDDVTGGGIQTIYDWLVVDANVVQDDEIVTTADINTYCDTKEEIDVQLNSSHSTGNWSAISDTVSTCPTNASIYEYFILGTNENQFKASTSGLATQVNLTDGVVVLTSATETQIDGIDTNVGYVLNNQSTLHSEINGVTDEVWDELLTGATHNIATSAGRRLRQIAGFAIRTETAQDGTINTIVLDASASSTDGIYNRDLIVLTEGTGEGQTRIITEYNGTTKNATINRDWKIIPDATSVFQILANDVEGHPNHGYAQVGGASNITLEGAASSTDDIYNGDLIYISTGTGAQQARLIVDYNGTTNVAIVSPSWLVQPDSTSLYHIDYGVRVEVDITYDKTGYSLTSVTEAQIDRILTATEVRQGFVSDLSATTTKFDTNLTEANDFWNRNGILFTSGGNAGQIRRIKDFKNTDGEMTMQTTLNVAPSNGDTFVLIVERAFLTVDTADIVDAIWDELLTGSNHNTATSAGRRLREVSGYVIQSGTAQGGNGYSIIFAADASDTEGIYNRNLIVIVGGAGAGQTRTIVNYNGTSKTAVVDRNWKIAPNATSEYFIVADDTPLVVNHGIAQGGSSTSITLHCDSSTIDDTYKGSIVNIMASTGVGEARIITAYNGTSKVATVTPAWITNPDATSIYVVMPYGQGIVCDFCTEALNKVSNELWNESMSGYNVDGTFGGDFVDADTWTPTKAGYLDQSLSNTETNIKANTSSEANRVITRGNIAWITGAGSSINYSATADAIWDELLAGHTTTGSAGKAITDILTYVTDLWDQLIGGW